MKPGVRCQKAVPHEPLKFRHETPHWHVVIDAPSTRLSPNRLVLTRACLRFTEPSNFTECHIEHHSPCLKKSRGFGGWPPRRLGFTERDSEIFFRIDIDQK